MQITHLNLDQLKKLSTQIHKEIAKRNTHVRQSLLKRMEKLASEHGLSLSDLVGVPKPAVQKVRRQQAQKSQPKQKLPPKYWNPLNPKEGWSGHARRPQWVRNWLENGGQLEELLMKRT